MCWRNRWSCRRDYSPARDASRRASVPAASHAACRRRRSRRSSHTARRRFRPARRPGAFVTQQVTSAPFSESAPFTPSMIFSPVLRPAAGLTIRSVLSTPLSPAFLSFSPPRAVKPFPSYYIRKNAGCQCPKSDTKAKVSIPLFNAPPPCAAHVLTHFLIDSTRSSILQSRQLKFPNIRVFSHRMGRIGEPSVRSGSRRWNYFLRRG